MGGCMSKDGVSEGQPINVLIVGANGKLGALVTKHCLAKPNLRVNILVRDASKCSELVESVKKAGGRVFIGDITQPESIKGICQGMHTVISTISGADDKVPVDGQKNLLAECVSSGVKRFVPSDFGVNYSEFSKEYLKELPVIRQKIVFEEHFSTVKGITFLRFWQGVFTEMYFILQSQGFHYWGNIDQPIDLTTFEDTARVVASAVSNPKKTGNVVFIGEKLTTRQIAEIYNRVRGTNVEPRNFGTLQDATKTFYEKIKTDFGGAIGVGIESLVYDPRGQFKSTNNANFPDVKVTTLEEFLKQNPDMKLT